MPDRTLWCCSREGDNRLDSSELEEDVEYGTLATGFFTNLTTNYYTSKRVVIKSRWLQVPNLVIQIVVLCLIVFQLCYDLRFMHQEEVVGNVDGELVRPLANWDGCVEADVDCLPSKLPVPAYCHSNQTIGRPFGKALIFGQLQDRVVSKCWRDDVHVAPGPKIFIPTMVTHMYQRYGVLASDNHSIMEPNNSAEFKEGSWITERISDYYIENIEHFLLTISHAFVSEQHGSSNVIDMSGTLFTANGTELTFARSPSLPPPESGQWIRGSSLQVCGGIPGDEKQQLDICSRTAWGDVISVHKLLQYANRSLDAMRMNSVTYRQSGLSIDAQIRYHNTQDFWTRIFFHSTGGWSLWWRNLVDPPLSYNYRFVVRNSSASSISRTTAEHPFHVGNSGNKSLDWTVRLLEIRTGIQIDFSAGGVLGAASADALLLSGIKALTVLSIATLIVEHLLTRIYTYMRYHNLKSVGILFQASKEEETLPDEEFIRSFPLEAATGSRLPLIHARARAFQQTALLQKVSDAEPVHLRTFSGE